ncbi:MAG: hypothetical protein HY721_18325 [Planctomycetes bacterium]|nr:hypothetical protein [Planctomycetota bacterium]
MFQKRLFCYVDETGQEARDALFLVAIVLSGPDRDQLAAFLLDVECATGKRLKWHRSKFTDRVAYLRQVLPHPSLRQNLLYATYQRPASYLEATIDGVARALRAKGATTARTTVIVDGLRRTEVPRFAAGLRARGIHLHKVRSLREESDPILRLADALAGFLRDLLEGRPYARELQTDLGLHEVVLRA